MSGLAFFGLAVVRAVVLEQLGALEVVATLLHSLAAVWAAAARGGKVDVDEGERLAEQLEGRCLAGPLAAELRAIGLLYLVRLTRAQIDRERRYWGKTTNETVRERWWGNAQLCTEFALRVEDLAEQARGELAEHVRAA